MANLTLNVSSSGLTAGSTGDYGTITIVEGGILTDGAILDKGGNINVSSGGKAYDVSVTEGRFWASGGGYVSGVDVFAGSARFYLYENAAYTTSTTRDAIVASDVRLSGGTATIRGIKTNITNFTVLGGTVNIQNGAVAENLVIRGGNVTMAYNTGTGNVDYNATTLTAKQLTVSAGGKFTATGANGKTTVISGLNVEAGANVTLQTSVTAFMSSGNTVEAGVVSNAALISANSGAMVRNVVLSSGGSLYMGKGTANVSSISQAERGGTAQNVTAYLGARIQPQAFGVIEDTVLSGGTAQIFYGASSFRTKIYDNGYERVHGNCVAYDTEVFNGCQFVSADAQLSNGVEGKGGVAVRTTVYEGGSLMVISGGTVSGATIKAGGQIWFNSTTADKTKGVASAVDLKVEAGGSVVIGASGAYTIALGGAETTIAVGAIAGHESAFAADGVLHDMDWSSSATILSGLTVENNTVETNASVCLTSGASAKDVAVNDGTFRLSAGASGTGADVTDGKLYLYDGAEMTGVARPDIEFEALRLSGGTAVLRGVNAKGSDFTVRGGKLHVQNGAVLTGLNVSNTGIVSMAYAGAGNVDYDATSAVAKNAVIYAGGSFYAGGNGIVVSGLEFAGSGYAYLSNGAAVSGITNNQGSMYLYTGAAAYDLAQTAGTFRIFAGASGSGADVRSGNVYLYDSANQTGVARSDIKMEDLRLSGGQAILRGTNAKGSDFTVRGGTLHIQNGADLDGLNISNGGSASMSYNTGTGNVDYNATSITASRVKVYTGGSMTAVGAGAVVSGLELDGGYFYVSSGASVSGLIVSSGRFWASNGGYVSGVDVLDSRFYLYDNVALTDVERAAIVGSDIRISGGSMVLRGVNAYANDITLYDGRVHVQNSAIAENVTVSGGKLHIRTQGGGNVDYDKNGALVRNAEVFSGGIVEVESGGVLSGGVFASGASMTVYKYGQAGFDTVAAGAEINLNFWDANGGEPGNADALVTDWGSFAAGATVNVANLEAAVGREYKVADSANANVTLHCNNCYRGVFDVVVKTGETASNAFQCMDYDFTDGKTVTFSSFTVGTQTTAAELDNQNATVLADGGLATKWDGTTDVSTIPAAVAGGNTTGDAWLTVDGANLATALYGAEGNFAHDVNLWLHEGTVRNLAAGATAGGSVENVRVILSDDGEGADKLNFTGVAYLGGFGTVTGEITAAVYGGTFSKDFYAGALANKLATNTAVGGIDLTVTGGKFKGNIYGASAVKTAAGVGSGVRNTTGDVTLTIIGGETTKGTQACIFAGGYATGDATGTVYTVDSVTATISGGSWGAAAGGRGVFGGIMASGVTAQAGDVSLTISGDATMGNVYGGGWAQKTNGKSIVGDVNINIAGGTIANVFGGGSHSSSGGTTETGDVTITVSDGDITGAIYARGQLEGDTTGAASVIFTGATDFGCGVYGYSYVGGDASDATLSFAGVSDELTGYTGTFSGAIGGFSGVTFAGATAMTLATAAGDVSNGAWEFDLTDRASSLAGTSLLTWSTADFENDTVRVSFADDAQAQGGWNIAAVAEAFSGTTFDIEVGESQIATGLAYNQQIASGDYQGWGFTLDEGVLKFKNLA